MSRKIQEEEISNECKKKRRVPKCIIIIVLAVVILSVVYFVIRNVDLGSVFTSKAADQMGEFVDEKIMGSEGKVTTISRKETY